MKKNGFVMIETIVVITILSVGLISLFSSYSLLLTKASVKSKYDNVEYIYKAYFVGDFLKSSSIPLEPKGCVITISNVDDLGEDSQTLKYIMTNFNIEKIYYLKDDGGKLYNKTAFYANLSNYDGSSILYLKNWKDYEPGNHNFIVKFKEDIVTDNPRKNINFASIVLKDKD